MPVGKPAKDAIPIGTVFLGKYRVDAILGSGGMGVVAQCTHLQLNERVAVKMLRSDVLVDQDAVERFTREAQAAAKLKSEYVAHVSDVGRFETGVPYMVMEFLEGLDLDQLVEQRGCLPVPWACELMLQACEALAEAHSIGIVHRDVKPSNLFVTWRPDGSALVKVLDFGISKSSMGTDLQLTQTQSLLGTPAYMSPEQMRSARLVDARTDIWSLGTVLYEVLEGRKPFEAESFSEMCVKVAVDAPAPMANTPLALQGVILRCLAKQPEQRYATMAELARDLVQWSQDPRSAQVLVERMYRMLRRSVADGAAWEGMATGTGQVKGSLQGVESSAAHAAAYGTPAPGTTPLPMAAQLYQPPPRAQSPAPIPQLETTLPTHRAKRKSIAIPLLVALLAASTIGVTIGIIASGSSSSSSPSPSPKPNAPVVVTPPAAPPPAEVKPAPPPAPPPVVVAPPVAAPETPPPTPPVVVKKSPVVKKKDPVAKKEPVKEPPPVAPPPPQVKTTNPFDDRTGTGTGRR